jgi:hypothetical protein
MRSLITFIGILFTLTTQAAEVPTVAIQGLERDGAGAGWVHITLDSARSKNLYSNMKDYSENKVGYENGPILSISRAKPGVVCVYYFPSSYTKNVDKFECELRTIVQPNGTMTNEL